LEAAVTADPAVLAPLKLHYLKWQLFEIEGATYFQYEGIFDTDFDKYTEDAVMLFSQSGVTATFENLEGFPEDWKERPEGFVDFVRAHHVPSFVEYAEYPYVTSDEIKKALRLKAVAPPKRSLRGWQPDRSYLVGRRLRVFFAQSVSSLAQNVLEWGDGVAGSPIARRHHLLVFAHRAHVYDLSGKPAPVSELV
jgi:hypothetical protein